MFFAGFSLFCEKKFVDLLKALLAIVSLIISVLSMILGKVIMFGNVYVAESMEGESAYYAEFLTFALLVLTFSFVNSYSKKSLGYIFPIVILTLNILLNNDFSAIIVLLLLVLVLLVDLVALKCTDNRTRVLAAVVILVLTISLFFIFYDGFIFESFKSDFVDFCKFRIKKWPTAKEFIRANPIVGVGPQNTLQTANNFILQIGMYHGMPGILIFLYLIISVFMMPNREKGVFVVTMGLLLSMTLSGTTYYMCAYLFLLLGCCSSLKLDKFSL